MPSAIRTDGLTKYFGPVVGVERLSLDVAQGEVFGFLGPNGSGKTTTIRLLLDLLRPTSGDAWICGFHTRTQGLDARRCVGYLPGELPIYPELTGSGFLRYLEAVGQQAFESTWLEDLFRRFDVSDLDLARPMRDYSQGMKRKLGIIQALAARPAVLVLDEPTNGLDPLMIEAFAHTIQELKKDGRTTIFLSSHVLSEVEKTCDRIGLIRRGELAVVESLASLRASMPRRVTVTFAGAVPAGRLAAVAAVGGVGGVAGMAGVRVSPSRDGAESGPVVVSGSDPVSFEVHGPLGPFVTALAALPIDDVQVETSTLEDYVLRFYAGEDG